MVEKSAPTRGPKPSLSRAQIARIAIRLVDQEGMAGLTMQRLSREIGLTTMALYRYFPGKAELIALMIDSVADSSLHFGKPSLPWSKRLKEWGKRCLAIYQDHPWFLEATTTRQSPMGPNELAWMEAALAMLAESGLEPKKRYYAFFTIIGHVRGHATFQSASRSNHAAQKRFRELIRTLEQKPERYPIALDIFRSGASSRSVAGAFDFGLECILDGIRAQMGK